MDYIGEIDTKNIEVNNKIISIIYNNDSTEILELNMESYKNIYAKWFANNKYEPIYISTELKKFIDNLKLLTETSDILILANLDNYFIQKNNVKEFIKYTRLRIKNIEIENDKLTITRYNNTTNIIDLDINGFKKIFNDNFTGEKKGMFLSDKHKIIIKSLNFIKIDKNKDINTEYIKNEFKDINIVMKFFEYLDRRPSLLEKELVKWKKNT